MDKKPVSRSEKKRGGKTAISYVAEEIVGTGCFGTVYKCTVVETGETVAIKKVLQDRRFKNRELQIMRDCKHVNIVGLQHCFYSKLQTGDDVYLNLVMNYVPGTIHRCLRDHTNKQRLIPMLYTKVYFYQMLRAAAHIHAKGICHRDIKPQNFLLHPDTHKVYMCDFGSAKVLVKGQQNIAYISSRYYRAPELIFEARHYSTSIDMWSLGCVLAEMMLGNPLFPGESGVDQLIEVIKVLGTPTPAQMTNMNPDHSPFSFPQVDAYAWEQVFSNRAPKLAIDLIKRLMIYEPNQRIDALEAMAHPFFDELRLPNAILPNGKPLPALFDFSPDEVALANKRGLLAKLSPRK